MSTPQNTPPPGSTGGTAIRIPPAGSSSPTPDPDQNQGRHPQKVSFVSKAIGFILKHKLLIVSVIIAIFVGIPIYTYFSSHRTMKPSDIDAAIMSDREELKRKNAELERKVKLAQIETLSVSNALVSLLADADQLTIIARSNEMRAISRAAQAPAPTVATTATTNIVGLNDKNSAVPSIKSIDTGTQSQAQVSTGLVIVKDNHGDIKITIENGDGEKSVRDLKGPDKGEDLTFGIAKPLWTEPIKKIIPPKGNGVRYYIPKGWSVSYKYYCAEKDFKSFINRGSQEVPKWVAIDVYDDGISESIWIKNVSSRYIELIFTLTPAE